MTTDIKQYLFAINNNVDSIFSDNIETAFVIVDFISNYILNNQSYLINNMDWITNAMDSNKINNLILKIFVKLIQCYNFK